MRLAIALGQAVVLGAAFGGLVLLLGGTGPEAGLHWGWLFPLMMVGAVVGLGGVFAGAAMGN